MNIEQNMKNIMKNGFSEEMESLSKYKSENPYVTRLISDRLSILKMKHESVMNGDYRFM